MPEAVAAEEAIPHGSATARSERVEPAGKLTHVDAAGAARMVDVAGKPVTERQAGATGFLATTPAVVAALRDNAVPKGDALAVARIAGIMGAKRTAELIPLCHPIGLHGVTVDLEVLDTGVRIGATTRTADRTGVEMEALTAVAAAGLALIDMVKALDRAAMLTDIRVTHKSGGRSGEWCRADTEYGGASGPGVIDRRGIEEWPGEAQ